uniref:Uncharacterized protein n=1 Tax=Ficedula albicollis TaxID=59894 RepID=A0A803W244_FICAL
PDPTRNSLFLTDLSRHPLCGTPGRGQGAALQEPLRASSESRLAGPGEGAGLGWERLWEQVVIAL